MSVHNRNGRWFVQWYEGGKLKREWFGCGDIGERRARERDEERKRNTGKIKLESLSVTQVCQEYHNRHLVAESTHRMDNYKFAACLLPVLGNLSAECLTSQELSSYVETRILSGVRRTTIAREIRLLKAALNWAASQDPPLIVRNPVEKWKMPKANDAEQLAPPSMAEIERILAVAEPHLVRAILLQYYSGMRPGGEIERLRWDDWDEERGMLRVESARKGLPSVRFVPCGTSLFELLKMWREVDVSSGRHSNEMPIVHFHGERARSLKRTWARAKKLAGITRKIRLYDLRHAMATAAIQGGADMVTLSQILGHSRPDTTMRHYIHVDDGRMRQVAEMVPKVRVMKEVKWNLQ